MKIGKNKKELSKVLNVLNDIQIFGKEVKEFPFFDNMSKEEIKKYNNYIYKYVKAKEKSADKEKDYI